MRLAIKTGLLCGTGAFLLATYTAIFKNVNPDRVLLMLQGGLIGTFTARAIS